MIPAELAVWREELNPVGSNELFIVPGSVGLLLFVGETTIQVFWTSKSSTTSFFF
jgi:hypothetical protein